MPAVPLESRLLQALAPWREAGGWCVAFSGGLDSTVLLHLLAQLARSEALPALSALHVHHGLQAAADGWPAHCQAVCRSLGIPLRVERVQVAVGGSIEQAARDARYRAFQANLGEGQVLLTAQHLDDQAETLLFRLLRGAGLRGLAAMPVSRPLGGGRLCRPLLGVSRAELEAYAQTHRLDWVEDPSNQDPRFSRNYLRREIMPRLASHWPQASPAWRAARRICARPKTCWLNWPPSTSGPAANPRNWIGRTGWICPGSPWSLCAASALRASATCCGPGWDS